MVSMVVSLPHSSQELSEASIKEEVGLTSPSRDAASSSTKSKRLLWKRVYNKVFALLGKDRETGRVVPGVKILREKHWAAHFLPNKPLPGSIKFLQEEWAESHFKRCSLAEFLSERKFAYPVRVRFLSPKELRSFQCSIQPVPNKNNQPQCQLLDASGSPLKSGEYIYILSAEGTLYVTKESEYQENGVTWHIKHGSLSKGKGVRSAGEFTVVDGILLSTVSKSGHYRPQKEDENKLIDFLQGKGVDINTVKFEPIPKKD